jgi:IclR family acetate operon transcriptional repressor
LAQSVDEQLQVREIALPLMRQLRDQFNETVNLGVIDHKEVAYIAMIESRHSLRMQTRLGSRDPVYSTALGKAILTFMPEARWPNHVPAEFVPRTINTHRSMVELKQDLVEIQRRGYSVDLQENELGAYCIGAPIFDHLGQVTAALSVSAPASRLDETTKQAVATAIIQSAATISQQLGHNPG